MRINSISSYYPSFGYSSKTVKDKYDEVFYRTTTYFYRPDMDWKKLSSLLAKKYKNADKDDVINYACSTGEETYTLITQLLKDHGPSAFKFFPIVAKDLDEENIEIAKKGVLVSDSGEMQHMGRKLMMRENDFFIWGPLGSHGEVRVKDVLKENAKFSQADIHKDFEAKPMRNTVLLCRNVWPYFYGFDQENLIKKISESFVDDSSLLIVGDFDIMNESVYYRSYTAGGSINDLLKKYGFVQAGQKFVYQKAQR